MVTRETGEAEAHCPGWEGAGRGGAGLAGPPSAPDRLKGIQGGGRGRAGWEVVVVGSVMGKEAGLWFSLAPCSGRRLGLALLLYTSIYDAGYCVRAMPRS